MDDYIIAVDRDGQPFVRIGKSKVKKLVSDAGNAPVAYVKKSR